jgi:3D (Asp-Asp-Asp) domain-containing protein
MSRLLSRSSWRKAAVLVTAVVGFVLVYEARVLDSRWQALIRQSAPPDAGQRLPFDATAYCKGTTTASGVAVRTGIAAADPKLLPVGSVLNIATGEPRYNGIYTVMDTGPSVQGRVLDLYMWSCHEALRFGRRHVDVTVLRLGWDPQASAPGLVDRLFRRREAARRAPPPVTPPPAGVVTSGEPLSEPPEEATPRTQTDSGDESPDTPLVAPDGGPS